MKIKFLAVLGLAAAFGSVGCKGTANTNTTTTTNTTMTNTMSTTTTPMPTTAPAMDMNTQKTVESAITKAGITGVTVEATTTEITLRGSVADKAKMAQAVQIANEKGGGKKVTNQLVSTK